MNDLMKRLAALADNADERGDVDLASEVDRALQVLAQWDRNKPLLGPKSYDHPTDGTPAHGRDRNVVVKVRNDDTTTAKAVAWQRMLNNHVETGRPLSANEVDNIVGAGLAERADFDRSPRGGFVLREGMPLGAGRV